MQADLATLLSHMVACTLPLIDSSGAVVTDDIDMAPGDSLGQFWSKLQQRAESNPELAAKVKDRQLRVKAISEVTQQIVGGDDFITRFDAASKVSSQHFSTTSKLYDGAVIVYHQQTGRLTALCQTRECRGSKGQGA